MAITFSTADCDVFARNPKKVKWPDEVSEADRKIFIDIRDRIQQLAKQLASSAKLSLGLKPLTSLYEVSGRSVTDIWCCVYPSSVPNKSYAFQVALIISQHGAEMCFCAGAGRAEIRDPKKARDLQGMFDAAKQRLASIPPGIVASVENALEGKWFYRKSWREKKNQQQFHSLSEWITYASSPQGNAASVSIYFDPNELTKMGDQIDTKWARALEIFAPLLEFTYGNSPGNRYWIFQGNPRLFGVDEYIRTRDEIRWSVRQHADLIHNGDMVLMWRSGENAGVVAVCLVQSEPDRLLPEDAPEIWHQKPPETEMRCKLKVLERFLDHPVSREAIGAVLPNLTIIRAPQGTNFSLTQDEYAKILSLRNQQPESSLAEILRRYHDQQIVFQSSVQKRHYAIGSVDDTGASVERLDDDKPEPMTFAQAEKILQRLQAEGQLEFTSIDDTAAVRNAILQAEPVALSADQKDIRYLGETAARLANFLQVLDNLRMADPLYKPAMLLCILDGIDSHNLLANEIAFDWVAPRFIDKLKSLGREVTAQQAAQPFYHLCGDLFWMHAVKNLKDRMQDGRDGPKAAREKVKYALLKDTYWNLLQDPTSRTAVRKKLESIMPTSNSAPELPPARNIILYGPPGTGKTYTLRKRYMEIFTDRQVVPTSEEQARALVQGLSWWEIAALTLLDVKDHRASVSEMIAHPLVKTRGSLSANKNVRSTLWRVLQMHTKAECETVKVAARNEPLLFSKDKESIWSIDEQVAKIEAPELEKWLNEFHNPTKQTIPITHRYKFTTFHQSFSYEDFIEGIKPQMEDQEDGQIAYEIRDGIFKEICQRAEADPAKPYALLIDEINRGNVASIFGELITLIEDDKRLGAENELKAVLPYSRKEFGVPGNLYIIGTMNTADRSVEALDTALRRRFTFEEMRPDSDRIQTPDNLGVDLRKLFDRINARLEQLLDHDHCIGHAYFMEIKSLDDLRVVFANKIIPLLKEYFYGHPAKIGMVLGEPFIFAKKMKTAFASGDWGVDELDEKAVYEFADVSQLRAEAFASIYA